MSRRAVLRLIGSGAAFSLARGAEAQDQNPTLIAILAALGEGKAFNPSLLVDLARILARRPYAPFPADLPEGLNQLSYDQYVQIRSLPQARVWNGEGRGFAIDPLHRGAIFGPPVRLFIVEDGVVRRIAYDPARFDFGRNQRPGNIGDIGFSGFRLFTGSATGEEPREIALFQGASFFRLAAQGQNYGSIARGLTLRPGEIRGEEFPYFRAFWIERPNPATRVLIIHALLDSESATGAFRLTVRPEEALIVDVEAQIFARSAIDHYGIASVTSTYLFGDASRRVSDDPRRSVFEAEGLQILSGAGEWLWRPLTNPSNLQISVFSDDNPKGFGLIQRQRTSGAFDDHDQKFEAKPSLWIEPIGDWGAGAVQLIEIPSDSERNDNILAYWRPKAPVSAGGYATFAYRQFWAWDPPGQPDLARVATMRIGRGSASRRRRFFVDFENGGRAFQLGKLRPQLSASPGTTTGLRLVPLSGVDRLRVDFELDPGGDTSSELRLQLVSEEGPASETLLYRWTS